MKKIVTLCFILLLICGAFLPAQELTNQELTAAERLKVVEEVIDSLPFKIAFNATGMYAPFLYRGYGDLSPEGLSQDPAYMERKAAWGPAYGVGTAGDGQGAFMGFELWGNDKSQRFGIDLKIKVASNGGVSGDDITAFMWAKPFKEILEMKMGLYYWDDLENKKLDSGRFMVDRGYYREGDKNGGFGEVMGGYGGNPNIFNRVESPNTLGLLILLTPPSSVPDWAKGFTVFTSLGSSGGLDPAFSRFKDFGANTAKNWKHVFATPHVGIGYQNYLGMVRFQYRGGNYLYGQGLDQRWGSGQMSPYNMYLPRTVSAEKRLEAAVGISAIPDIFIDIGFKYPLPLTRVLGDAGEGFRQDGADGKLGPSWLDLGWRGTTFGNLDRIRMAENEGDVWYGPKNLAIDVDYTPSALPAFNIRFSGAINFGQGVAFANGASHYKAGNDFSFGVQPQYDFDKLGLVSINVGLRYRANDTFLAESGKTWNFVNIDMIPGTAPNYLDMARESFNHNGYLDLGLGAFITKQFLVKARFKFGIALTLPISGDRYTWSVDAAEAAALGIAPGDAVYFSKEVTERVKQGNLLIAIPLIFNVRY